MVTRSRDETETAQEQRRAWRWDRDRDGNEVDGDVDSRVTQRQRRMESKYAFVLSGRCMSRCAFLELGPLVIPLWCSHHRRHHVRDSVMARSAPSPGVPLSPHSFTCFALSVSVFGVSSLSRELPVLGNVHIDPLPATRSSTHPASIVFAKDYANSEMLFLTQAFSRTDLVVSVEGVSRPGSSLSVSSSAHSELSFFLRSLTRLTLSSSAMDLVTTGSLPVLQSAARLSSFTLVLRPATIGPRYVLPVTEIL